MLAIGKSFTVLIFDLLKCKNMHMLLCQLQKFSGAKTGKPPNSHSGKVLRHGSQTHPFGASSLGSFDTLLKALDPSTLLYQFLDAVITDITYFNATVLLYSFEYE